MHWCSWIDYEISCFWSFRSGRRYCAGFNSRKKGSFVRVHELVVNIFAKFDATPRAHRSWCKVSWCDCSSNFGVQRLRSWGSHFWVIPRDGSFLHRILIWCHVPWENLTACFDPNFPCSRRMLENALSGTLNWQTEKWSSSAKLQVPDWMITKSKKEELESVGELSQECSQIVLKCWYVARIGRPDILRSVNKLARAVAKWTQACDRRLARLISYIHYTNDYRQYCHVGNTAQHCRQGLVSRLRFCCRPWGLNINFGESLMYLWKPNICPHQLDVQEANVSIPQFYRIWNHFVGCWTANGWTACSRPLGLGDRSVTFIEQYQNTNQPSSRKLFAESQIQTQTKGKPRCWSIVACEPRHHKHTFFSRRVSGVHLWRQWSSDKNDHQGQKTNNETRVKNPQSCSWLVIRQNDFGAKDPNQMCWHQKPTRRQLSKGSFTRDEWCHLIRLLNIMNSSMFSCSHFLSHRKLSVMSKRAHESSSKEGSAVAKPRPMNLVSRNLVSAKKMILRKILVIRIARWIKNWIRVVFHPAAGNWRETSTQTPQCILKRDNKMTLNLPAPGNWGG